MASRGSGERRRRHDDAHFPMQGRGKRATPNKNGIGPYKCPHQMIDRYTKKCCRCGVVVTDVT